MVKSEGNYHPQWEEVGKLRRRLRQRDQEMAILRQRVRFLIDVPTSRYPPLYLATPELVASRLRDAGFPERQVKLILDKADRPSSPEWSHADERAKALAHMLSSPSNSRSASWETPCSPAGLRRPRSLGPCEPGTTGDAKRKTAGFSYAEFLERLARPESRGLLDATRRFVMSILGPDEDGCPPQVGLPGSPTDLDFHGTAYIVERYVMTKIHQVALGGQLDGAADTAVAQRLSSLQFLTPDDLDVGPRVRDQAMLSLAQEALRNMGQGKCPADIMDSLVRCCDIIFSMLQYARGRAVPGPAGESQGMAHTPGEERATGYESQGAADEFFPVFLFVVLKANTPRLHSMCKYVQAYYSPTGLISRPGYCFVNLKSAVQYLMNVDAFALKMDPHVFARKLAHSTDPVLKTATIGSVSR